MWVGVGLSALASIVLGAAILKFYGGLNEKELFEGLASIFGGNCFNEHDILDGD